MNDAGTGDGFAAAPPLVPGELPPPPPPDPPVCPLELASEPLSPPPPPYAITGCPGNAAEVSPPRDAPLPEPTDILPPAPIEIGALNPDEADNCPTI